MNLFEYPLLITLVTVVCYALYFLYLRHLQNLLKMIAPVNRSISPNAVWVLGLVFLSLLSIVPLDFVVPKLLPYLFAIFLIVFQFYLVAKLADSIKKEFVSRNMEIDNRPTFALGVWMCLFDFTCHTLAYLNHLMLAVIAYIVFLICFFVYWVEINNIRKELRTAPRLVASEDSIFNNL